VSNLSWLMILHRLCTSLRGKRSWRPRDNNHLLLVLGEDHKLGLSQKLLILEIMRMNTTQVPKKRQGKECKNFDEKRRSLATVNVLGTETNCGTMLPRQTVGHGDYAARGVGGSPGGDDQPGGAPKGSWAKVCLVFLNTQPSGGGSTGQQQKASQQPSQLGPRPPPHPS